MNIYQRLVERMQDKDTDYASILITGDRVEIYTSLSFDDLKALLMEMIMLEKDNSIVHLVQPTAGGRYESSKSNPKPH